MVARERKMDSSKRKTDSSALGQHFIVHIYFLRFPSWYLQRLWPMAWNDLACFSLFMVTSIDSIQKNMRNRFRIKMEADRAYRDDSTVQDWKDRSQIYK